MKPNKTQPNDTPLDQYYQKIEGDKQRADAKKLSQIITEVTGDKPVMWGTGIVGFGTRHYKYDSGRQGDTMKVGFAVRKKAITIYGLLMYDQNVENIKLAKQLGPHDHGKGCLYIKSLADIKIPILRQMIINAYASRALN